MIEWHKKKPQIDDDTNNASIGQKQENDGAETSQF